MHVLKWMVVGLAIVGALGLGGIPAEAQEAKPAAEKKAASPLAVWNTDLVALEATKTPSPVPELKPVVIVGTTGGTFSGKVMVSGPIKGLKAKASKLSGTANDIGAEMIVMASHRPEMKDFLLGPNAARVVRHAKRSVTVIR